MGFYEGKLKRLSLNNFILFLGILDKSKLLAESSGKYKSKSK